MRFDVTLCDAAGDVLVRIEGLAIQPAPHLAAAAHGERAEARREAGRATGAGRRSRTRGHGRSAAGAAPASPPPRRISSRCMAAVTKIPAAEIDPKRSLENYGIDSVMIMTLTEKLQATYGEVPRTLFFEYQDLHAIAEYFVESHAGAIAAKLLAAAPPAPAAVPVAAATGRRGAGRCAGRRRPPADRTGRRRHEARARRCRPAGAAR